MTATTLLPRPSRRAQGVLLLLYLLLLAPAPLLLQGWQWPILLSLWLFALWRSWQYLRLPAPALAWDGGQLLREGVALDASRSRVLPGCLWLVFAGEGTLLFADQLDDEAYRALARAIHLGKAP